MFNIVVITGPGERQFIVQIKAKFVIVHIFAVNVAAVTNGIKFSLCTNLVRVVRPTSARDRLGAMFVEHVPLSAKTDILSLVKTPTSVMVVTNVFMTVTQGKPPTTCDACLLNIESLSVLTLPLL